MSETTDSPAPQGSEQSTEVELPEPTSQQPDDEAARTDEHRPDLDQRQEAIRTERRAAGPESTDENQQGALENESSRIDDEPETDPLESAQE